MGGRWQGASDRFAERLARVREWLRLAMPRVALGAGALFLLRLFVRDTEVYQNTAVGLLGPIVFLACAAVLLYYGAKILVRLKRALLWRVRRRLIITYLFVGLTPVVLLLGLGALAATGGSSQAMVRVVTVQVGATEREALEGARALADALLALPPGANGRGAQAWLDERTALLQASLPGARVYVWRGDEAHGAGLGEGEPAQVASARVDAHTLGVGFDDGGANETLPLWLEGRARVERARLPAATRRLAERLRHAFGARARAPRVERACGSSPRLRPRQPRPRRPLPREHGSLRPPLLR